jgi:Asp-tRNA(Asn)/Glu-tRNA(Gln) amidotransferase A subunit family amidase
MTQDSDVTALSAVEVVRRINDGSLTAENYASRSLARYEGTRFINAVTWINQQQVLENARSIDLMRRNGQKLGPLAGLPVALKDNIDAVGFPSTGGTPSLKGNFPKQNAPVVERLFSNGAYLFGKTNMHELAKGATSSNIGFGSVRNPVDPKRIPGGSSGGSGAALAAQIVPLALGTDTAGSVRVPAALCGVAGFRPSINGRQKLYSDEGVLPLVADFDTIGAMARNMEDIALLHSVVTASVPQEPASLKGLRIGIPRAHFYDDLEPEVERVIGQALLKLREAGAVLVDIDLADFARSAAKTFWSIYEISVLADLEEYLSSRQAALKLADIVDGIRSPDVQAFYRRLSSVNVTQEAIYQLRSVARPQLAQTYAEALKAREVDVIAFPAVPIAAPLIREGGDEAEDANGNRDPQSRALIRNTCITALVNAPAVSIPAGHTAQGLPVGIEFDGINGGDSGLLALALAAEKALAG